MNYRTTRFFLSMMLLLCGTTFMACGSDSADDNGGTASATITLSVKNLEVPAVGGSYTIDVKQTGREWNARATAEWLKVTTTGSTSQTGTIAVVVAPNKGAERTATITVKSGLTSEFITVTQGTALQVSAQELYFSSRGETLTVDVTSSAEWTATTSENWLSTQKSGNTLAITTQANDATTKRTATVEVATATEKVTIAVTQESAEDREMNIPDGYKLVWHDEFSEGNQLNSSDWEWETWETGRVNHELQYYRPGTQTIDGKHTTEIIDGRLYINCFKGTDGKVYSGRVNAKNKGKGWQYGYFEARILLPKGKGTWPAYWMMPVSVDWNTEKWPNCGEIDIMEEVGCVPNEVSSSLHAEGHNHTDKNQITQARNIGTAETEYHVYALEWTADYIKTYVDGQLLLSYNSDHTVRNYPYDKPFHLILNLAWGGDWGGMKGVDESALPLSMKVDYVRVFQKK